MAHLAMVELLEELGDGRVHLLEMIKSTVPQSREDPALSNQHRGFNFSLVARLPDTCWEHTGAKMRGEVAVRGVHFGLVAIRMRHARAKVVANRQGAHALEVGVHPSMAVEPHRQLL